MYHSHGDFIKKLPGVKGELLNLLIDYIRFHEISELLVKYIFPFFPSLSDARF